MCHGETLDKREDSGAQKWGLNISVIPRNMNIAILYVIVFGNENAPIVIVEQGLNGETRVCDTMGVGRGVLGTSLVVRAVLISSS